MRVYADSDVWISYFDAKDVRHGIVMEFFEKLRKENDSAVITAVHLKEMGNTGNLKKFEKAVKSVNTEFYDILSENEKEAFRIKRITGIGFDDCLHLAVAKRLNAVPVSYDNHWEALGKIINQRALMPGEFLKS